MTPHRDVLFVDDDAATRILLETLCSRAGLTVRTASNGEEAVAALSACEFNAIVMDLFMPRLNGIDLLNWLTLERRNLLPRVIVLSAAPEGILRETRRNYPVRCTMRKPVDINELMENVIDCIVSERHHPAPRAQL